MKEGMVIPIGRGKEIAEQRTLDRVRDVREKWGDLQERIGRDLIWREKLLKEEQAKPGERQNNRLIEVLEEEMEKLNALATTV